MEAALKTKIPPMITKKTEFYTVEYHWWGSNLLCDGMVLLTSLDHEHAKNLAAMLNGAYLMGQLHEYVRIKDFLNNPETIMDSSIREAVKRGKKNSFKVSDSKKGGKR